MAAEWYVGISNKVHGPFNSKQLKQLAADGKLPQTAVVRQGADGAWHPATKIKGLFEVPQLDDSFAVENQPVQQQPVMFQQSPAQNVAPGFAPDMNQGFGGVDQFAGFEAAPQPVASGGGWQSAGGGGGWDKVGIGLFILAIAMCVVAGGSGMKIVAEMLLEGGIMMTLPPAKMSDVVGERPPRPSISFARTQEDRAKRDQEMKAYAEAVEAYNKKVRDYSESLSDRRKSARTFSDAGRTVFKISIVIGMLGGVACIVGYVFCVFSPSGTFKGLAIAAICLASVNAIMRLVFKMIPALDNKSIKDHLTYALFAGRGGGDTGNKVLSMFVDLAIAAEFIIAAILIILLAKAGGFRGLVTNGMLAVGALGVFAAAILLTYIWAFVDFNTTNRWPTYLGWMIHWLANFALVGGFIFLIRGLFVSKGAAGRMKPGAPAFLK